MADFRKWFTVLAVLALMAGVASAQVGSATGGFPGTTAGLLACVATAAGTPELRPEGYTELAGDIVISCTGGQPLAQGAVVPTTNIVIYMAPAVPITSRLIGGGSEALLIIDEAGSNLQTGALGFGPQANQTLCTTTSQQQSGGSPCTPVAGLDNNSQYEVAKLANGNIAPNVFQGKVGDFGSNSVAFYNVPVLPPATVGVTRTFRITNIRVPVPGGNLSGTLQAVVSTSPSAVLPVAGTALNIGVVGPAMTAAVKAATNNPFKQCVPTVVGKSANPTLTANIIFTEGFATGFKTRVVPGGANSSSPSANTLYAAEATNSSSTNNQNIPGGLYAGFANNSESGFIFPGLVTTNSGTGALNYTAGLADYGTRMKAVFYNIPSGLTLYVSTTSSAQTASGFTTGGTSVLPFAVLVGVNSGEATPDSFGGTSGTPITSTTAGSDGLGAYPVVATSSGSASVIWEVTNSNPSAVDSFTFSVYIAYSPTSSTTTNPYGLPITDLPVGAAVNDVQLSLAPEPGGGTFSTANATQGQIPTPRFAIVKTQEGRFTTINLCQTTLLYPYVIGASGFDTGIAIANTSMDPFGTTNQTGSCKLYGYGVTVGTTGNTAVQSTVPGCDSLANPLPGTNCFAIVPAGQVMSVMATSVLTNFQGYVIAVCNFQFAHGYAAVTDLGLRNLWSSYLALELTGPMSVNLTNGAVTNGLGGPRNLGGASGIENLVH